MAFPSHFAATGMIIWSDTGRVLMVQTHNRIGLILPGGIVEADESPARAGEREVDEEVGLTVTAVRLLVVEHRPTRGDRPSNLQFVFEATEKFAESTPLRLQPEEIREAVWLEPHDAVARHTEGGRRRMSAALAAAERGSVMFLDETGSVPRSSTEM